MSITIIIKDGKPRGRTRTSLDRELVDKWWGSSFRSEEDKDKCSYVERKVKKNLNADEFQVPAHSYNKIGS